MPQQTTPARIGARGVQAGRAALAAIAALMITFSPDHSAALGLAVFSGFAVATAIVWFLGAWLSYPAGRRSGAVVLGALTLIAGLIAAIEPLRTIPGFFVIVGVWAAVTAGVELAWGLVDRRRFTARTERTLARDAIVVAAFGFVLAVGLALVPMDYNLPYEIVDNGVTLHFTLTGITIAVGLFGGYAALVAVYLAIAALSPRADDETPASWADAETAPLTPAEQA